MRPPSLQEKKKMLKELRLKITRLTLGKDCQWHELTAEEKKFVDQQCKKYYDMLQF